ncbi:hypothetical protein K5I29_01785 [Flavobacterium agricola]|uniref:Uncharacterized protein n=1 Tax=Flavobacterium agricola TaxID=2870839 RepID=A0ABY6M078_9FLAO|nr:hypothetical protein [Flavobacterium agricola]UYW01682.1 hypothetical protein K5I29_01785 [Flavobacterium agricola]
MKKVLFLFVVLCSFAASAQKVEIIEKKYYINGEQIPAFQLKQKMKQTDAVAYENFKTYTNRTSWGGFLLGFGCAMLVADAVKSLVSDESYPSAFSAVGAASLVASYPFLKGRKKKLNKAIDAYNNAVEKQTNQAAQSNFEVGVVSNSRGVGLQINF